MIVVRNRECGNVIEEVLDFDEGREVIERFEAEDKAEGTYTPDFYEVAEISVQDVC